MKLILARHGETIENRRHILQGQTHGKLTSEGISQANKLADYLTSFRIDICFTSDLQRAVDTANIIAQKHPLMEIIKDVRLRERYLGELQGEAIPDDWDGTNHHETAEPMVGLYERAKDFASYLQSSRQNKTILVISHGITLKVLISICLGYDESQLKEMDDLANCTACILQKASTELFLVG
jgi:probable phosphoglycerate mutase